jgi:hypothetical protein
MGTLFDMHHIAYIIISMSLTTLLLVIGKRHLGTDIGKARFLKAFAVLTVFLHISPLWINFLKDGQAMVADNMLFPIYFCNMSMYLLMVTAFVERRDTRFYRHLAAFTAYAGIFGGMISLFYPDYYLGASSMFEWGVFKSMASHSTMVVGAAWLFVGGYAEIGYDNALSYVAGLLFYGLAGVIVNTLFVSNGLRHPNAMYLDHPPLSDVPWLNYLSIPVLMVIVILMVAAASALVSKGKAYDTQSFETT